MEMLERSVKIFAAIVVIGLIIGFCVALWLTSEMDIRIVGPLG
jgi:ABC-type spermidine/putrescine transport system permease subunit I